MNIESELKLSITINKVKGFWIYYKEVYTAITEDICFNTIFAS